MADIYFARIPVLNLGQFQRFMSVIRKLGDRVEREHTQHLRDSQRIEDRSSTTSSAFTSSNGVSDSLDFASLVAGAKDATVKPDLVDNGDGKSWDDDVWGSILGTGNEVCILFFTLRRWFC